MALLLAPSATAHSDEARLLSLCPSSGVAAAAGRCHAPLDSSGGEATAARRGRSPTSFF